MITKVECRQSIRKIMSSLKQDDAFESRSLSLAQNLRSFLLQNDHIHKKIGGFYPLDDEANWLTENEKLNLLFPKVIGEEMVFKFCTVNELEEVKAFGRTFKEPKSESKNGEPDLILVPGLAFDRKGHRLGRGKGYYDKYLSRDAYITIGLCLNEQLLDEVPVDSFDVDMDYIITDREFIETSNRRER